MSRLAAVALHFPKWATHLPSERYSLSPPGIFPFTEEARISYDNALKSEILGSKVNCDNAGWKLVEFAWVAGDL